MKIAIYAPFTSKIGGAYHYYISLVEGLLTSGRVKQVIMFTEEADEYKGFTNNKLTVLQLKRNTTVASKFRSRIDRLIVDLAILLYKRGIRFSSSFFLRGSVGLEHAQLRQCDLVILTAPFADKRLFQKNVVCIIHDLFFLPQFATKAVPRDYYREIVTRICAKNSVQIISESPLGKSQIISTYAISEDKISLLPTGPANFVWHEARPEDYVLLKSYSLPETYVFYPGHIGTDKNQIRVLEALEILKRDDGLNIHLVLTVPSYGVVNNEYFQDVVNKKGLSQNVLILCNVEREIMPLIYKKALCLCMASYIGPTNMPIWEAMALGCPVIASNIGDHRWQVGNEGLLFNPDDAIELAQGLKKLYFDEGLRKKLITSGRRQANLVLKDRRNVTIDQIMKSISV